MIAIKIAQYSDCGGREYNEDSYGIYNKSNGLCVVVADGLGGHGGGQEASKKAVAMIEKKYKESEQDILPEHLAEWIQDANEAILALQTKQCEMKTTIVTFCMERKTVFWAHVGDSRLYHFRNRKLQSITFDHSVTQMAVLRGEISWEAMRGHEDRNRLLRALGKQEQLKVEVSEVCECEEEEAFLLCTDGFWEYVLEEEMERELALAGDPKMWMQKMREILNTRADHKNDNNTAVAVWITDKSRKEGE